MTQAEMIGWVVIALGSILTLTALLSAPSKKNEDRINELNYQFTKQLNRSNSELTKSINELIITVKLLNQTIESFGRMFEDQQELNDEFEMRLDEIENNLKDFKHNCEKIHYYKQREP